MKNAYYTIIFELHYTTIRLTTPTLMNY